MLSFGASDSTTSHDILDSRFALPVEIHGHMFQFGADHGASTTMVTDLAIAAAGLPHQFATATRADTLVRRAGVDPVRDTSANFVVTHGDSVFEYWGDFVPWVIDSIRIASSLQTRVFLALESPAAPLRPFDGILGRDMLSQFDLEFNLPQRRLRLYARSATDAKGSQPWLPAGIRVAECLPANVIRGLGIDTAGMDSTDRAEIQVNPGKRVWNQEELLLPLTMNGHRIDGFFDSGSGETLINWAAARALGLDRTSPTVTPVSSGSLALFSFRAPAHTDGLDTTNYQAAGITLRLGRRTLPADSVLISDLTFGDFANFRTKPMILVGLRHFRDNVLFLSYSTRKVCVGRPTGR